MKKQVWSNDTLTIQEWQYVNKEEEQYLVHLRNIINTGDFRENRTAVSSYSLFCPPQLRFDLRNHRMPLLTTKKSVLRQIFVELQFYLSGSADSKKLEEQKVFVWKGNTTREFLDKRGLGHYREGDMGPSYSFNFRHFGATYVNCDTDYTGQGFDQVQYCIDQIKNQPTSRRIIIDLWDGSKLDQMSLPPCMHKYQFYVNQGYLSCHAELRSSDTFLGLPWNIGTASLLVYMLAHTCNLLPGDLIITINDAHVYENQIQVAQEQILRQPYTAPLLYIKEGTPRDLFAFKSSDFELLNYQCQEKLSVPMVV
jgi:thymidylate synthase